MSEQLNPGIEDLKAWMLMHRIRDLGYLLHDRICAEHGLTVEQYTVLSAIKYFDDPVLVGDVARWMGHKVNSASMIADRMVNAGLLERTRDLPDRRQIRLTITRKGEEAFKQATPALWSFVQDTMSSLSDEEERTLARLLEKVRDKAFQHPGPHVAIRTSEGYDIIDLPRLIKRLGKYAPRSRSLT